PKALFIPLMISLNTKKKKIMSRKKIIIGCALLGMIVLYSACSTPYFGRKTENKTVPVSFVGSTDSANTAKIKWKQFFTDQNLVSLIDTALKNNQELNIILQEINIAKNEIRARKGA